jgi:UTP--glucose-1-phosphate uridylyltransferase
MWPASRVFPKELFPIGRLPAIGYIVWEMASAGIENIVVVISRDNGAAIKKFLDRDAAPPANVRSDEVVQQYTELLDRVRFDFVEQDGPYGNGTPLVNAGEIMGNQACVYGFGDDIVLGENVSAGLVSLYARSRCPILAVQSVDAARTAQFGILETTPDRAFDRITRFIEKPAPGETRSTLASLGRYLVTPELLADLRETPIGRSGELWFSDAVLRRMQAGSPVAAFQLQAGKWFTVGDPDGFAAAIAAARSLNWRLS